MRLLKKLPGKDQVSKLNTLEKLDLLDAHGLLYYPEGGKYPRFKRVLGRGLAPQDIILDTPSSTAGRRAMGISSKLLAPSAQNLTGIVGLRTTLILRSVLRLRHYDRSRRTCKTDNGLGSMSPFTRSRSSRPGSRGYRTIRNTK